MAARAVLTELVENEKYVKSVGPIEVHLAAEPVGQRPPLHEQSQQEVPDAGDDGRPELVEQQHDKTGLEKRREIKQLFGKKTFHGK